MNDKLQQILAHKRSEVAAAKARCSAAKLHDEIAARPPRRSFAQALRVRSRSGYAVIAEIKRASPSKGVIRADFDPAEIATRYERGGATCLSVLTDTRFFQGSTEALLQARAATSLPVLRKDFVLDGYQLLESAAMGADCVLLIVAALGDGELADLHQQATALNLDVLVEVHNEHELDRALAINPMLLGINNRNLKTFETQLSVSERLARAMPHQHDALLISESGINHHADLQRLSTQAGICSFLVGESLMREPDPGQALVRLLTGR